MKATPLNLALLQLLADGHRHSGAALAQTLGVSRTAVWKQAQRLRHLGLPLDGRSGQGYRVSEGIDLLSQRQLLAALSPTARARLTQLELVAVVDSTNLRAQQCAEQGVDSGYVCIAECQTAGRGRLGRPWFSPFGASLYLSFLQRFDGGINGLGGMSLAIAVAIAEALEQIVAPLQLEFKWPNDILWRGRKLAGVLLELGGDPSGSCHVVAGIGINVCLPTAQADTAIDQAWTDLATAAGERPSRNALAAAVLDAVLALFDGYARSGFARWRERWQARDALLGQSVVLRRGTQELRGIAEGIAEDGSLWLRVGTERQRIAGGEVSLRAQAP